MAGTRPAGLEREPTMFAENVLFAFALTLLGSVREILGAGSIFGWSFLPEGSTTILLFILSPGAFITLGFLIALINVIRRRFA